MNWLGKTNTKTSARLTKHDKDVQHNPSIKFHLQVNFATLPVISDGSGASSSLGDYYYNSNVLYIGFPAWGFFRGLVPLVDKVGMPPPLVDPNTRTPGLLPHPAKRN